MKKCPVCQIELTQTALETDLPAYECGQGHGLWISANEYLSWVRNQSQASAADASAVEPPTPAFDTTKAVLCPDCGRILRRYKIWPEVEFYLDRCSACNGVWFDQNEWQALRARRLHNKVNLFFTEPWQQQLRNEEMHRQFEKMYLDRFGVEDYAEIKRIRAWLKEHRHGPGLLAYLTDKDPYKG